MATMFVLVRLPAAGKTTRARLLADQHSALRLTPDEWMIPLFGGSEAGGRRDVLEGRMITLALQLLPIGTDVVVDFGCWTRHERWALHWLAEAAGGSYRLVYLPVDRAEQLRRIDRRWSRTPSATFAITADDVDRWRAQFEVPDDAELAGSPPPRTPPPPLSNWLDWATSRWPSLTTG